MTYRGRFAPSPTGPLHSGSLVAAVASFLDARANGGHWWLRIDDIDPPRHDLNSFISIPECLRIHGLHWDNDTLQQSKRQEVYEAYLDQLKGEGLLFTCVCTRLTLGKLGQCEADCASRTHSEGSLRFNVPSDAPQSIDDLILGQQTASERPNNFVVKRKDGAISYQLATAVDDLDEAYTHIIRGADLLESSFRQKAIQQVLKRPSPQYGHVPIVTDSEGYKLSKQNGARGIDIRRPVQNLRDALSFLRQPAPPEAVEHIADVLEFAQEHWDTSALSPESCNFLPR